MVCGFPRALMAAFCLHCCKNLLVIWSACAHFWLPITHPFPGQSMFLSLPAITRAFHVEAIPAELTGIAMSRRLPYVQAFTTYRLNIHPCVLIIAWSLPGSSSTFNSPESQEVAELNAEGASQFRIEQTTQGAVSFERSGSQASSEEASTSGRGREPQCSLDELVDSSRGSQDRDLAGLFPSPSHASLVHSSQFIGSLW